MGFLLIFFPFRDSARKKHTIVCAGRVNQRFRFCLISIKVERGIRRRNIERFRPLYVDRSSEKIN